MQLNGHPAALKQYSKSGRAISHSELKVERAARSAEESRDSRARAQVVMNMFATGEG